MFCLIIINLNLIIILFSTQRYRVTEVFCSAEPTVAGRRVKQFPNSAAVSISIYNAIKSAAFLGLQILILIAGALQMLPNRVIFVYI